MVEIGEDGKLVGTKEEEGEQRFSSSSSSSDFQEFLAILSNYSENVEKSPAEGNREEGVDFLLEEGHSEGYF